jgi:GNAT superfamily N-acetyltransferase
MPVETWDTRSFTPAQARAIGELLATVWPKPNVTAADRAEQLLAQGRMYVGQEQRAPRSFVFVEEGRVLAHAGILPRRIGTASGQMTIAGLARVCTDPRERGRGLGELVARAALGVVDLGNFPWALFQTSRRVQAFYERLGAAVVENPVVNSLAEDPTANPFWDEIVMRYPAHGDWPAGTIDLLGAGY